VLCSDGLWNYLIDPAEFARTVRAHLADAAGAPEPLLAAARSLTAFANAAGGSDNITVAITPVTP
jgi:serine/threonine protein phosphatase PrpC